MKKLLIGVTIATIAAILLKRFYEKHDDDQVRTTDEECPYLIERDKGGNYHAVYFSS